MARTQWSLPNSWVDVILAEVQQVDSSARKIGADAKHSDRTYIDYATNKHTDAMIRRSCQDLEDAGVKVKIW